MTHVAAFEASAELMCTPVLCVVRTIVAARYAWYFGSVIGVLLGGAPTAADVIAAVVIAAGVAGVLLELLDPHAETPMPADAIAANTTHRLLARRIRPPWIATSPFMAQACQHDRARSRVVNQSDALGYTQSSARAARERLLSS
jgi:hypothetical protein